MATSKLGTWIYEKGTATGGGGGGTVIPDVPPVVIDDTSIGDHMDGNIEVAIYWHPAATATAENFTGVHVYLEDPDVSDKPAPSLDGTVKLNDTTQQSGAWKPQLVTDA